MKLLIDKETIAHRLREVAARISRDYEGKDLVVVMVLKGALCLVADLIRELTIPFTVETVQCSSYGSNGTQRGELSINQFDLAPFANRHVLIVDDIFDSGHTLSALTKKIDEINPASIDWCVLLDKQNVSKVSAIQPKYTLFSIDNLFVVGYGLDFKEKYRGLPGIYQIESP